MTSIPFDDARWKARPKAAKEPEISSDKLVMVNNPKTDWWRTLERDSKDGLVYGFEVELGSGIEISVELDVEHKDRYDQSTLFLHLNDTTWVKAGLELDGPLLAGGVVTNPYSDWAVHPHPGGPKRFTISLKGRYLRVFEEEQMIREVNVFGDGSAKKAWVGVMGCSPLGEGSKGTYKGFTLKTDL